MFSTLLFSSLTPHYFMMLYIPIHKAPFICSPLYHPTLLLCPRPTFHHSIREVSIILLSYFVLFYRGIYVSIALYDFFTFILVFFVCIRCLLVIILSFYMFNVYFFSSFLQFFVLLQHFPSFILPIHLTQFI